jgi:hypothetical protein
LAVTRTLAIACVAAGLCLPRPGLAVLPATGTPIRSLAVPVQDKSTADFTALDAQLEAAAITAALIRTYNVVLVITEQNLRCMSAVAQLLPKDSQPPAAQPGRQSTLEKEAAIRGAMDTALESYLRLIGEIENTSSLDDVNARADAVQRSMGFRGQGSIKAALPTILLHIKLIHAHATPSRDTILKDLSALPSQ